MKSAVIFLTTFTLFGLAGCSDSGTEGAAQKALETSKNTAQAEKGLTICNKTKEITYVSVGFSSGGGWVSSGWYIIAKGKCQKLIKENIASKNYYIHASGDNGSKWGDEYVFCTDPTNAFEIKGDKNCESRGYKKTKFFQIKADAGVTHLTQNLTGGLSKPPSGIDALDVGDGVYVQGIFSDELAVIVRIDRDKGMVKVRRSSDGTTKWVNANKVLSREQSQVNDIGRSAIAIGAFLCVMNPEACKKK